MNKAILEFSLKREQRNITHIQFRDLKIIKDNTGFLTMNCIAVIITFVGKIK